MKFCNCSSDFYYCTSFSVLSLFNIYRSTLLLTICPLIIISDPPRPLAPYLQYCSSAVTYTSTCFFSCSIEKPKNKINRTASSCIRQLFAPAFDRIFKQCLKRQRIQNTSRGVSASVHSQQRQVFSLNTN